MELCKNYECDCNSEYAFTNGTCEKLCSENRCFTENLCPKNSTCDWNCDDFQCHCNDGFKQDGDLCVPICDENQCQDSGFKSVLRLNRFFDFSYPARQKQVKILNLSNIPSQESHQAQTPVLPIHSAMMLVKAHFEKSNQKLIHKVI